jgi:hypothetical protein
MKEQSASAINLKAQREEGLKQNGYNDQDINVLGSLEQLEEYPALLSMYLEQYIHIKVMHENESRKLKESVLKWWNEHKDDVDDGRHSAYNIYDKVPEFVMVAMGRR